ncbi:MAG: hypothetical protein ACE5GA_09035 [Candidatus Zixiibacteriota bacterium]
MIRKIFVGALLGITVVGLAPSTSLGAGASFARSAGMGGAHIGLAEGVAATFYNPANLGLSTHQRNGIFLAGVGVNISNNSFTLSDYNKYTGSLLTSTDKQDILNKIPVEGLVLNADAQANAAGVSYGRFAVNFSGFAASELNLGHELVDLFLNGNALNDTVSLDGMYGSGWSYGSADISFGTPLYTMANRQLTAGFTFRYLKGLYFADVTEITGQAATLITGFQGDGVIRTRTAEGGSGYALDLGMALQVNRDYTVGIKFENFLSSTNWNQNPEEHGFIFNFDSVNIDNSSNDSVFVTSDYSRPTASFSEGLPSNVRIGIANTTGKLLWAFDWEQGFKRAPGISAKPQFSLGAEYSLLSFLPVRAGVGAGGRYGSQITFGSGLRLPFMYLDVAMLTAGGGLDANNSKGARFAASAGVNF